MVNEYVQSRTRAGGKKVLSLTSRNTQNALILSRVNVFCMRMGSQLGMSCYRGHDKIVLFPVFAYTCGTVCAAHSSLCGERNFQPILCFRAKASTLKDKKEKSTR